MVEIPPTTIFNLTGSIASTIGSLFVIVTHCFLGLKQDSVRTRLIISLAVAEFLNSFNNSASGIAGIYGWKFDDPWCIVNGFVGQWTVVTADVTVLAIAISTTLAFRKAILWHQNLFWVQHHSWLLIIGLWSYALLTALIALLRFNYVRSAPNWCWIGPQPAYARYMLAHGPRIIIIVSIICMYSWLYVKLKKGVKERISKSDSLVSYAPEQNESFASSFGTRSNEAALRKLMSLMIIFPTVYTVLWMPGIVNRFYNLSAGSQVYPVFLNLLQGLTQWIGFANGIAYGLNEEVKAGFRKAFRRKSNAESKDVLR